VDMEDHGAGVNMALMDDDLEQCGPAWEVGNGVLLPLDNDLCLGFFGQGVHVAMVKLGIVLGCPFLLIDVGFGMTSDFVKSQPSVDVEEVGEILIRFVRVFWDHQDVHPLRSSKVARKTLILWGSQLKGSPGSTSIPAWLSLAPSSIVYLMMPSLASTGASTNRTWAAMFGVLDCQSGFG